MSLLVDANRCSVRMPANDAGMLPPAIHQEISLSTVRWVRCFQPPTALVVAEYIRSVPTAPTAETPNMLIRTGAISDPAPIPVAPTRIPTTRPATTSSTPVMSPPDEDSHFVHQVNRS